MFAVLPQWNPALRFDGKTQIDEINSQIEPIVVCIKADRLKANIEKKQIYDILIERTFSFNYSTPINL